MQFASYNALCADPITQAQFLETLAATLSACPNDWKQREAVAAVSVGGKPLSISKYLATLDDASTDWDFDDDAAVAARFVAAAKGIVAVYPAIDVPTFTFRYCDLPGSDTAAPVRAVPFDSGVSANLVAPTMFRGALLQPVAQNVTITVEPASTTTRKLRR